MAGYGGSLDFDENAMKNLPTGTDKASFAARKKLWKLCDYNGNGIASLAECDRLIAAVLRIEGVSKMKLVINRAFHASRDIVPSVGAISAHYVDFNEFRFFLIYLKMYLELFIMFAKIQQGSGKYSDRRLSYPEFESTIPTILKWGVEDDTAEALRRNPQAVFRQMDDNGGGVVLFDEFAHWALWNHVFKLDEDDGDLEDALEVLKNQKPNLCGKDLTKIKASKAKYRADAKISGQGCLGGDPSLSGGYEDPPSGGAALAAGGHYPGSLNAWKASFSGAGKDDSPGMYRAVARVTMINEVPHKKSKKIGEIHNGDVVEVLEVKEMPEINRVRGRVESPVAGWISLVNTKNAFRWVIKMRAKRPDYDEGEGAGGPAPPPDAWKDSLARCQEADNDYEQNGVLGCMHGCGQPRFSRYPTCCTHCKGEDGPHARDCKNKGYIECVNGCGHSRFGKYKTCCTHCRGPEGPHARGCYPTQELSNASLEERVERWREENFVDSSARPPRGPEPPPGPDPPPEDSGGGGDEVPLVGEVILGGDSQPAQEPQSLRNAQSQENSSCCSLQ